MVAVLVCVFLRFWCLCVCMSDGTVSLQGNFKDTLPCIQTLAYCREIRNVPEISYTQTHFKEMLTQPILFHLRNRGNIDLA